MKRIFLSPSNQTANVGAYKNTNEHEQCVLMANAAKEYLEANYECVTEIAEVSSNMKTRAQYANVSGADVYVAIHTNAFRDPSVSGTETFYYSSDKEGKHLAEALLNAVSALTKVKRSAKTNDSLIELNTPTATRAYLEVDFHSNPERAVWIQSNTVLIGETIAKTIADFMKLETVDSVSEIPTEEKENDEPLNDNAEISPDDRETWIIENIDTVLDIIAKQIKKNTSSEKKYYRVQLGAYTDKNNAHALADKLREAGFNSIIKYS